MDGQGFVDAIKKYVVEDVVNAEQSRLYAPAGRKPHEKHIIMSKWYNGLNDHDKSVLMEVIRDSVEMTIFSFISVIDGSSTIEHDEKGRFKLFYEKNGVETLLNPPQGGILHEML